VKDIDTKDVSRVLNEVTLNQSMEDQEHYGIPKLTQLLYFRIRLVHCIIG